MNKPYNVLVIGGLGFIGWGVTKELIRRGHYVNIYDRSKAEKRLYSSEEFKSGRLTFLDKCNTSYFPVEEPQIFYHDDGMRLEYVDAILHLGEFSRVEQSMERINLNDVIQSNVIGTANILNFLLSYKDLNKAPHLFYAGSSTRFSSQDATDKSLYAFTKANNADFVKNISKWFGYKTSVLYYYNVFGDGRITNIVSMQTVIDAFYRAWRNNKKIKVYGGSQSRLFTYIEDVSRNTADLILNTLAGEALQPEYNMVSSSVESITIKDLARMFYDDDMIEYLPERTGCREQSGVINNAYGEYHTTVLEYVNKLKQRKNDIHNNKV